MRFSGDKFAENILSAKEICISDAVYPVKLSVSGAEVIIRDAAGAAIVNTVIKDGEYVIIDDNIKRLVIEEFVMPVNFELMQNYPNPFNPLTTIRFALPEDSRVTLEIFNSLGERVCTLINEEMKGGYHQEMFDAAGLSSGLYFYSLNAGEFSCVKKMLLIK